MNSKKITDEELMRKIMEAMIYDEETGTAFVPNYLPPKIENYSQGLKISQYEVRKLMKRLKEMCLITLVNYLQQPSCSYEGEWDYDCTQFYGKRWTQVSDIDKKAEEYPWLKKIIEEAKAEAKRQIDEVIYGSHDEDDYE